MLDVGLQLPQGARCSRIAKPRSDVRDDLLERLVLDLELRVLDSLGIELSPDQNVTLAPAALPQRQQRLRDRHESQAIGLEPELARELVEAHHLLRPPGETPLAQQPLAAHAPRVHPSRFALDREHSGALPAIRRAALETGERWAP